MNNIGHVSWPTRNTLFLINLLYTSQNSTNIADITDIVICLIFI